jgi:hypothetical protein
MEKVGAQKIGRKEIEMYWKEIKLHESENDKYFEKN